jgi:hypothetical protein
MKISKPTIGQADFRSKTTRGAKTANLPLLVYETSQGGFYAIMD